MSQHIHNILCHEISLQHSKVKTLNLIVHNYLGQDDGFGAKLTCMTPLPQMKVTLAPQGGAKVSFGTSSFLHYNKKACHTIDIKLIHIV